MKLIKICTLIAVLFTLVMTNCKKQDSQSDEPPAPEVPDLETLDATVYDDGGLTLQGRINKLSGQFRQYGFVLASDSLLKSNVRYFSQASPAKVGTFKQDIFQNIETGKKYFYSVFAITDSSLYKLSAVKSFVANGIKRIKVDSISPLTAHFGDTLTIYGKYFSGRSLRLNIGSTSMYLAASGDSLIRFVVPDFQTLNPVLSVSYDNRLDTISSKFTLYKPTISSFTNNLTFRDVMTIKGDHFDSRMAKNVVKFGNVTAEVVSSTRKELKVKVPDDILSAESAVSVQSMLQETTAGAPFVIRKPELSGMPQSGLTYGIIKLKGKNFHPVPQKNIVLFEGVKAEVTDGNTSEIEVRVPTGPFPRKKAKVSFKLLDYQVDWSTEFVLKDTWLMVSNKVPFSAFNATGSVTVNNTFYVISRPNDGSTKQYLWKFIADSYTWEKFEIPFDFTFGAVTASSDRIYLYIKSATNNLWEYNPSTNTWVKKQDYQFEQRFNPAFFRIGNALYLGSGSGTSTTNMFTDIALYTFYKYETDKNTWTRVANYPASPLGDAMRLRPSVFVVNGYGFVGCGATNTGMNDFYKYDPTADKWSRIANFPDARNGTSSFVLNNVGYVVHGTTVGGSPTQDCFKYDATANRWIKMTDIGSVLMPGFYGISSSVAFSVNGRAYSCDGNPDSSDDLLYETLAP